MRPNLLATRRVAAALGALGLSACQPAPEGEVRPTSGVAPAAQDARVEPNYDWSTYIHGGSADLDFGDGNWSEGVSLFTLSCLPLSGEVTMSWGDGREAVLTAGTATETFAPSAKASTSHPVIAALKDTGTLAVGRDGTDMRLVAKAQGRADLSEFFAYCDEGVDPRFTEEAMAAAQAQVEAETAAAEVAQASEPSAAPLTPPADR